MKGHIGVRVAYLDIFTFIRDIRTSIALANRPHRKFVLNITVYGQLRKLGEKALRPESYVRFRY